jgi:hypothetical protein
MPEPHTRWSTVARALLQPLAVLDPASNHLVEQKGSSKLLPFDIFLAFRHGAVLSVLS